MNKGKITRTMLLLAALCIALLYGCKKNNPAPAAASIVGTWGLNSANIQELVNGHQVFDTTYLFPAGEAVYTFMSNGNYTYQSSGSSYTSGYLFTGSTLSLYDTAGHQDQWTTLNVISLSADSMALRDSFAIVSDTVAIITEAFIR